MQDDDISAFCFSSTMGDRFTVTKSEVDPLQRGSVDSSGSAYGATPTAAPQPAAVDAQPNSPVSTDLSAPDRGNANNNNDRRTSRDSTKKLSSGVLAYGKSRLNRHGKGKIAIRRGSLFWAFFLGRFSHRCPLPIDRSIVQFGGVRASS